MSRSKYDQMLRDHEYRRKQAEAAHEAEIDSLHDAKHKMERQVHADNVLLVNPAQTQHTLLSSVTLQWSQAIGIAG